MQLTDMVGIVGVLMMSVAYALVSIEKIAANGLFYPFVNALGSALVIFSLFFAWNLSAFLMEAIWFLISLVAIARLLYNK